VTCGCEIGGNCTKTTVCAVDSAVEQCKEEIEYLKHGLRVIRFRAPNHGEDVSHLIAKQTLEGEL